MELAMAGMSVFSGFRRAASLQIGAALLGSGIAAAQAPAAAPVPDLHKLQLRSLLAMQLTEQARLRLQEIREESVAVYPYGLSGTALSGGGLIAGQESKRVLVKLGIRASALSELVLSASAPLSEDEPRSVVMQLDGLANKSKGGVEFRWGQRALPSPVAVEAATDLLLPLCQEYLAQNPAKAPKPAAARAGVQIVLACDLAALESAYPALVPRILEGYGQTTWFLSVKADAGPEKFSFYEAVASEKATSARKWSTSLAANVGALLPNNVYMSTSVRVDDGYEASKQQAACADSAPSACPLRILGGPSAKPRRVVELEARRFVNSDVGIAAVVRRDWRNKETSLEVPIYFVKDKDGGLTAGVSIGHVWAKSELEAGGRFSVFVGQTFRLGG